MAGHSAQLAKMARMELTRRTIDSSMLNVVVHGSTVQITGVIRPLRGHNNIDLKEEMGLISNIIRQRLGVHEVVWDVTIRA